MEVVGRIDAGYLVQITETEIGAFMGFGAYAEYSDSKADFHKGTGRAKGGSRIPTGTEINIAAVHSYLKKLQENQTKAKTCANVLRELADMITISLPEVVIEP